MQDAMTLFASAPPGLEAPLLEEVQAQGFVDPIQVPGGVEFQGDWAEMRRANLHLRMASKILARIESFMAFHLAQLDKRARKIDWAQYLRPDMPFRVEVTCRKSKIYHAGAAAQRIERALVETLGAQIGDQGAVTLKVRIDDNRVTVSLDTSGEPLHKRGHKQAVNKAPLRETMAAALLQACGYRGDEPVLDPMCGSGTFVIEAAERALGLAPGRTRSFAFEQFAHHDAATWAAERVGSPPRHVPHRFVGYDRDAGAIRMSGENAARAGVDQICTFQTQPVSALTRPDGSPGLVMINPPYGGRIGNRNLLFALYGSLGDRLGTGFSGWRVGLLTNDAGLAKATGLPFDPPGPPIAHGGLKVTLWRTRDLP